MPLTEPLNGLSTRPSSGPAPEAPLRHRGTGWRAPPPRRPRLRHEPALRPRDWPWPAMFTDRSSGWKALPSSAPPLRRIRVAQLADGRDHLLAHPAVRLILLVLAQPDEGGVIGFERHGRRRDGQPVVLREAARRMRGQRGDRRDPFEHDRQLREMRGRENHPAALPSLASASSTTPVRSPPADSSTCGTERYCASVSAPFAEIRCGS
jgi:hypothetical protein